MELESLNATFVIDTFLLLLIGIGPKIALVPFLETTRQMPQATQRRVLRKMLTTAATVAVLLLVLGGLLTRLLHFSPGALGVASGIILLIIAVTMVLGQRDQNSGSRPVCTTCSENQADTDNPQQTRCPSFSGHTRQHCNCGRPRQPMPPRGCDPVRLR